MIIDKNRIIDGQLSWERGVDTHKSPARVPRNQSCLLINATTRKGFVQPRPGWRQSELIYETDEVETAFERGLFQGAAAYNPDIGPSYIIASISGRIYRINVLEDGLVQEIALEQQNASKLRQAWFCQVENFMVIQDGQSRPIIWSGSSSRRSSVDGTGESVDGRPIKEVPVGTVMEYSNGRLWVALPNGRSFVAGDGVYGPSGTEQWDRRDAALRFTENQFLLEGHAFAVPANMGTITAMRATAQIDTSLGQGELEVFTTEGAFSINVPFDREAWKLVNYPIKAVGLLNNGFLSQNSTINVNSDIWGRSLRGVDSFVMAQRDVSQWAGTGMSAEVDLHLAKDDRYLLRYASAALFDDRLLVTQNPRYSLERGVYHSGCVVMDFKPLSSIGERLPPHWEGLWTGLDILQILTVPSEGGVVRCFAITLAQPDENEVRRIQVWELSLTDRWNTSTGGTRTRTGVVVESPQLDFGNRLEQKLLEGADFWVDNVAGEVDFYLYHKPDQYPCWTLWKHWQVCAKTERCSSEAVEGCLTGLNLKPQFRARMSAQRPSQACIEFTRTPVRLGFTHQFRLEIIGSAELTSVRLLAERVLEATFGSCLPEDAECEEVICCPPEETVQPLEGTDQNSWLTTSGGGGTTGGDTGGDDDGDGGGGGEEGGDGGGGGEDGGDDGGGGDEPLAPGVPPPYPGPPSYPNPPELGCGLYFDGIWTVPEEQMGSPFGDSHGMGIFDEPMAGLESGVVGPWSAELWTKFGEFVAANGLLIESAQIVFTNSPGTYRRFNANLWYNHEGYNSTVTWPWILQIEYCLQS